MHMVAPTVDMADLISQHNTAIYQYHFAVPNSYHSIELNYVLGAPFSGRFADEMNINGNVSMFSARDRQLSAAIMTRWTNLAKYG